MPDTFWRTAGFYVMAAVLEIAGCFAFWVWLRQGRTAWWMLAGTASLALFAFCLTRVDLSYAGRTFAAYGGVYIVASLLWLRVAEGVRLDRWDAAGAAVCLIGAALIVWGPRT